jgi:hypothetical protein
MNDEFLLIYVYIGRALKLFLRSSGELNEHVLS